MPTINLFYIFLVVLAYGVDITLAVFCSPGDSRCFEDHDSDMDNLTSAALQSNVERILILNPQKSLMMSKEQESILPSLVAFLLRQSSQEQLIILHDERARGISAIAKSCQKLLIDTTVLQYEPDLKSLEGIMKSRTLVGEVQNILVLCSSNNTSVIFERVRNRSLESPNVRWLVVIDDDIIPKLQSILREGTQIVVALRRTDVLYQLYTSTVTIDDQIRVLPVGKWEYKSTQNDNTMPSAPGTRGPTRSRDASKPTQVPLFPSLDSVYNDFKGRRLLVSVVSNWPFFRLQTLPDKTVAPESGIDMQVITTLSQRLNFTYRIVVPEDGRWGGPEANGNISGMIGMVAFYRAHVAIDEITITDIRATVVDFTRPYYIESSTLVSRAPTRKDSSLAIFHPFTSLLWILLVIMTLIIGPTGYIVTRINDIIRPRPPMDHHRIGLSTRKARKSADASLETLDPSALDHSSEAGIPSTRVSFSTRTRGSSLSNYSFHMFRSLIVQGNDLVADRTPIRIVLVSWYIFCFIMYSLYSGTLTAFLTIPAYEKPIDSLQDLLKASKNGFAPAVQSGTSYESVLKSAASGIFRDLWQLMDGSRSFQPRGSVAMEKVLTDDIVYMSANLNSEIRASQNGRSRYYLARQTFFPQGYGIACRRGAPYIQKFDDVLVQILQAGLINKWVKDEVRKLPSSSGGQGSRMRQTSASEALSLDHLQAAFFILLAGALLSSVVFLVENASRCCCPKE